MHRPIQSGGIRFKERPHEIFTCHGLERLHCVQTVGQACNQRLQQLGLSGTRTLCLLHQVAEHIQEDHAGDDSGQGCFPRHEQGHARVDHRLDQKSSRRGSVKVSDGCPKGFAGYSVGQGPGRLLHVVFPACGKQCANERQPQIRRDMRDGEAHMSVGHQHQDAFQRDTPDDHHEQSSDRRGQTEGGKPVKENVPHL